MFARSMGRYTLACTGGPLKTNTSLLLNFNLFTHFHFLILPLLFPYHTRIQLKYLPPTSPFLHLLISSEFSHLTSTLLLCFSLIFQIHSPLPNNTSHSLS